MVTQTVLEMDFATEYGKTQRLRVYDVKPDITGNEISAAMDVIIEKNIFTSTTGDYTGKVGAQIVTKEVEEFDLV